MWEMLVAIWELILPEHQKKQSKLLGDPTAFFSEINAHRDFRTFLH